MGVLSHTALTQEDEVLTQTLMEIHAAIPPIPSTNLQFFLHAHARATGNGNGLRPTITISASQRCRHQSRPSSAHTGTHGCEAPKPFLRSRSGARVWEPPVALWTMATPLAPPPPLRLPHLVAYCWEIGLPWWTIVCLVRTQSTGQDDSQSMATVVMAIRLRQQAMAPVQPSILVAL